MAEKFDMLTTVEQGGCSAKIDAMTLKSLLSGIKLPVDDNVLVDISSGDDAGVYRINDDMALIVTTDFFPPVCSDAYLFGQIAATNSLSDVYAMGGRPLLVLNLNMFPSATIPIEVLGDILRGGQSKIDESGALTMGGHTIDDKTPKYGLAVVGTVAPNKVITNSGARVGDVLVLTKPLGCGVAMAAKKLGIENPVGYASALSSMATLNDSAAAIMQKYGVIGATDITGFGLSGHLMSMAAVSQTSFTVDTQAIPCFEGTMELLANGCIPGAAFKNLNYAKSIGAQFTCDMEHKMVVCDAQTSGGILMCVPKAVAAELMAELRACDKTKNSAIIGSVENRSALPTFR